MIRIFNKQLVAVESGSVYVADIYCDSSDTKPTSELANGSTLTEVDTGKRYLFNEATTSWVEVSGGGGGGSANKWYRYSGLLGGDFTSQGLPFMLGGFIEERYGDYQQHYGDLCDDMYAHNVDMFISVTVQDNTMTVPVIVYDDERDVENIWSYSLNGSFAYLRSEEPYVGGAANLYFSITKLHGIVIHHVHAMQQGQFQDLTPFAPLLPYTLDIYVHNRPSTPDEDIPYTPPND